ncbi:hypothetical protein CcaverHIS002_0108770 [Cutaneotrichosporon cavernicola]|nr:hypothetical protein CcaverHIS002_0108770 [Cutaneotrichosporon cavernicola]
MVSIEFGLYPHIWDAILSYTQPGGAAQVASGLTCGPFPGPSCRLTQPSASPWVRKSSTLKPSFPPRPTSPASLSPSPRSRFLHELVLVLPAYTHGKFHGRMPGIFMDHIVGMDTTELFMAYYDKACTFTIVGADEVLPGYSLCGAMADPLRRTMFEGFKPRDNGPGKAAKIKKMLGLIQFISRGEYIARVGKRIAELATVERL